MSTGEGIDSSTPFFSSFPLRVGPVYHCSSPPMLSLSSPVVPFLLYFVAAFTIITVDSSSSSPVVSRIAFGSCANQSAPQILTLRLLPIWNAILDFDPQLFIWMGDNIYGDNKRPFRILGKERTVGPWKNVPRFYPSSEQEMREKYRLARSIPGYAALRRKVKVIGTWDDHDYGLNDAGKEFSGKNVTQSIMLDFLDEAQDSARRKQEGVYASYLFGTENKTIKVILLDTRYHRDPLSSDGSILGESQWIWLKKQLFAPPSEITIIVSSIQVLSNISSVTGPLIYSESWGRFPKERDRLFKLIRKCKRDGIFFISGDIHFGEITRYDCACDYPLYDITSSGLTQAIEKSVPRPLDVLIKAAAWLTPTTMRVYGPKCKRRSCTYGLPNFGAVEIDWDATPRTMKLELRDLTGDPVAGVDILLSDIRIPVQDMSRTAGKYRHHCSLERDLPWFVRYRLVILLCIFIAVMILALMGLAWIIVIISKKCIQKFKID